MQNLLINFSGLELECGTDEAGRGCLAGPVVAAAVILPLNFKCESLNDSKVLNEKERFRLRPIIEESAIAWGVGVVDSFEIDRVNILNASILAMHKAIEAMKIQPEFIISDGNRFKPYGQIPYQTIVKGDSKYFSIAAASVLAKTYRDELMNSLHLEFPVYNWNKNKAYPTKAHREAIAVHGVSELHRFSFNLTGDKDFYEQKKRLKKEKVNNKLTINTIDEPTLF